MVVAAGPGLLPNPRATSWFDRGERRAWFGFASMNAWGAIDAIACKLQHAVTSQLARGC